MLPIETSDVPPPPAPAPNPRDYVVLCSGTFNPPHRGHVLMGLHAARHLLALGHRVRSVQFVPISDAYLWNKVMLKRRLRRAATVADAQTDRGGGAELARSPAAVGTPTAATPDFCAPMAVRLALLRALIGAETAALAAVGRSPAFAVEASDFEHRAHVPPLFEPSPGYWAKRLPSGYLETVPTAALIERFSAHHRSASGARVVAVFGADNLAGCPSWNRSGRIFESADVCIVGRRQAETPRGRGVRACDGCVQFARNPAGFLSALEQVVTVHPTPVRWGARTLFGGRVGRAAWAGDALGCDGGAPAASDGMTAAVRETQGAAPPPARPRAASDGTTAAGRLFLLPPLDPASGAALNSSTALMAAPADAGVLRRHGYGSAALVDGFARALGSSAEALDRIARENLPRWVGRESVAADERAP
jgi:nicotinic acid mononucleotide adenylyltransferase